MSVFVLKMIRFKPLEFLRSTFVFSTIYGYQVITVHVNCISIPCIKVQQCNRRYSKKLKNISKKLMFISQEDVFCWHENGKGPCGSVFAVGKWPITAGPGPASLSAPKLSKACDLSEQNWTLDAQREGERWGKAAACCARGLKECAWQVTSACVIKIK